MGIDFIGWKFDGDAILAQFMGKTGLTDSEAFSVTKTTGMTKIAKLLPKLMILDFGSVQSCALPAFTRLPSFPNMIMNSRGTKLGGRPAMQCSSTNLANYETITANGIPMKKEQNPKAVNFITGLMVKI